MIVVRLRGGLGNQLFQYATGRAVAVERGDELVLDASTLDTDANSLTPRSYALAPLAIQARLASEAEQNLARASKSAFARFRVGPKAKSIVYRGRRFNPDVFGQTAPVVVLDGYFQSEQYFAELGGRLRFELSPATPATGKNAELLAAIDVQPSIAVHVRRGDYVTLPAAAQRHGVLPLEYYQQAVSELLGEFPGARAYVFSDDAAWVREHLELPCPTEIVFHNPPELGYEDLRLMRACHSFVIANSSFSWWGAWLGEHPNKRVIAPKRWFRSEDEGDIVPGTWSRR